MVDLSDFTVRAGGIGKHYGAVTNYGTPALGHMDTQTIEEVITQPRKAQD